MSVMCVAGRRGAALVVSFMLLGVGGCSNSGPKSVTVPLKFRPTSQMNMNTFAGELPDLAVHVGAVTDARDNRDKVGENVEEKQPVPVFSGGAEPTEFVRGVMRDLMSRAGLKMADDQARADRVLVSELHRFWTQEGNTYEAEVRATVTVQDASGRQLWKGTVNGTAERFGRSLSEENYQEVFSDAMVNMVEGLLNNAGFRAALKRDARPVGQ
jgi:hypothetical protein